MIIRLGGGEKRLDANDVRAHWERLHNANQVRLLHILESEKNNLAAYLADQRSKRKLGGEMAWQDDIVRWRWSKGWLPKGFTKAFGRLWWSLQDISIGQREKAVTAWLHVCHANNDKVLTPPIVSLDGEITYPEMPEIEPVNLAAVEFDKKLMESVSCLFDFPFSAGTTTPVPNKIKCRFCPDHRPSSDCWITGCE